MSTKRFNSKSLSKIVDKNKRFRIILRKPASQLAQPSESCPVCDEGVVSSHAPEKSLVRAIPLTFAVLGLPVSRHLSEGPRYRCRVCGCGPFDDTLALRIRKKYRDVGWAPFPLPGEFKAAKQSMVASLLGQLKPRWVARVNLRKGQWIAWGRDSAMKRCRMGAGGPTPPTT